VRLINIKQHPVHQELIAQFSTKIKIKKEAVLQPNGSIKMNKGDTIA